MTAEGRGDNSVRGRRLNRLERVFTDSPVYFITACTAGRRPLLANAAVCDAFVAFAHQAPAHGAWFGAYVLMPDHLHVFITTDGERVTLSAVIKSLKNSLSKTMRSHGIAAPHWQKGFFDHLLRSEESYADKWTYVRRTRFVRDW